MQTHRRHGAPGARPSAPGAALLALAAGSLVISGCSGPPVNEQAERELRRSVLEATRRETAPGEARPAPVTLSRDDSAQRLGIRDDILRELEQSAGPGADARATLPPGLDLTGGPTQTITVSLRRAIRTAVDRNLPVQFARLGPAVAEAQVIAAEAAFDWTLFTNATASSVDSPQQRTGLGTAPTSSGVSEQLQLQGAMGLRRTLIGGGRLTVQHDYTYTDINTPGVSSSPSPAQAGGVQIQFDQPLLRGFGSEVTQAEIRLARNQEREAVQTLRRDLIRVVTDTERTYWQLVQAHRDVLILQRLLERGERVAAQLRERQRIDANQSQIAEAAARVERRRADVLRAQTQLRLVSDRLKSLMNDPQLPVGSEIVIIPADEAVDQPVTFSLVESIRQAILNRPEVEQAMLSIDEASIRQTVANNARLPDLNIRLQARYSNLEDSTGELYNEMFKGDFVDYLAGLSFEYPLGGRRAEAEFRRRRLERMQTVISYRNTVQSVTGEVKQALNRVQLNYQLIAQTRLGRIAASEALRVLMVEKEITQGYTIERLNIEFQQQEALAAAERDEVQSLVEYNAALADLFAAMGTALERSGIQFVAPTSADAPLDRAPIDVDAALAPRSTPQSSSE